MHQNIFTRIKTDLSSLLLSLSFINCKAAKNAANNAVNYVYKAAKEAKATSKATRETAAKMLVLKSQLQTKYFYALVKDVIVYLSCMQSFFFVVKPTNLYCT